MKSSYNICLRGPDNDVCIHPTLPATSHTQAKTLIRIQKGDMDALHFSITVICGKGEFYISISISVLKYCIIIAGFWSAGADSNVNQYHPQ